MIDPPSLPEKFQAVIDKLTFAQRGVQQRAVQAYSEARQTFAARQPCVARQQESEEDRMEYALSQVYLAGKKEAIAESGMQQLRQAWKSASFMHHYGADAPQPLPFEQWVYVQLSQVALAAMRTYERQVEDERRAESQRVYGHPGASVGMAPDNEGRMEAMTEAIKLFFETGDPSAFFRQDTKQAEAQ